MWRAAKEYHMPRHEVGALPWDEFKKYIIQFRYEDKIQEERNKKIAMQNAKAANRR